MLNLNMFLREIINFIRLHPSSLVWIVLTLSFLYMAWKEKKKAENNLESLEKFQSFSGVTAIIAGINFKEIIEVFKDELNGTNKESHSIASASYFWAAIAALASFVLSLL